MRTYDTGKEKSVYVGKIMGLFLIVLGVVVGIWLGIFVMFIGGIAQVINAVKMTPVDAMGIAEGLAKFIFSGAVGWLSVIVVCGTGVALIKSN